MNVTGTHDKEYPIHSALKSSSARCVKEIVKMYPKQLHTQVGPKVSKGGAVLFVMGFPVGSTAAQRRSMSLNATLTSN